MSHSTGERESRRKTPSTTSGSSGARPPQGSAHENRPSGAPRFSPRAGRREWILLGAILLMGSVLRFAHLAEIKSSPAFKYPAYDAAFNDYWAKCLATGDWAPPKFYSDPQIRSTPFFRPPGYPYFLAGLYVLTDQGCVRSRFIQMMMGLASCALAFFLGRRMFSPRAGLIFAAMMAVYWVFIYFEGELQSPVLMVFLTLAALNVIARWTEGTTFKNTLAAGVLVGLLGLVMPNALVLGPVALGWIWWVGRRRKDPKRFRDALVGLAAGAVIAIAPAAIRNYAVSGDPVLITSNAGINLYIGNNEDTDCVTANAPILGKYTGLGSWTCFDEPAIEQAVEKIVGRPLESSEVSRFFTAKALDHIKENPGKTLELLWRKALLFWGPAEISNNEVLHYDRADSRLLKFLPGFPAALALAIMGIVLLAVERRRTRGSERTAAGEPRHRYELAVLLAAFVAVYFASFLPFFIQGRYRIPIVPVLLLFGAYGIDRVSALVTARRFKTAAVWTCVFAAAYLGARLQLAEYRPDLGTWHFLRGDAYRKQGLTERARAEFASAVETSEKPNAVAYNNLGVALDQLGRSAEAVAPLKKAIEINPNFLDARRNLVSILLRMNRADEAYAQLVEVVRLDPRDAVARSNLGVCLMMQSRPAEALEQFETAVRLDPSYANARYFLARSLAEAGRTQEAAAQLRSVLELKPDHPGARAMLEESGSNPR
jgi:Flp pilus assembly protein TadD